MLEILQFYVSSFWIWAGLTYGAIVLGRIIVTVILGGIGVIKGSNVIYTSND